jgi:SET domain-containing protein
MSLELRNSSIHGKGVFTTESIRKHAVICKVAIVRTITEDHPLDASKGELFYHCHWYPDGEMVLIDEPFCYFNHSCLPNMFYYTVNRSIYCLAMRDIVKDEELTLDYSLCNIGGQEWDCHCGSVNCRGHHRCGFRYMEHARQIQFLPYLDPLIVATYSEAIQDILEKDLLK